MQIWEGKFGKDYTDRNVVDWRTRLSAFQKILEGLTVRRVLEVGCNRGHNLIALAELLGEGAEVAGLEPNRYALEIARASSTRVTVLHGQVFDVPFKDGWFDLVFTAGVLIHVAPEDLASAMKEIYRVSRRYILAIEYFAEEETPVAYRGHTDFLWKRNFLKQYRELFPDLALFRQGYLGREEGFDQVHWWLLEKSAGEHKR